MDFMPHGHCYLWRPGLVWLEVLSNLSIGLAYLSISATLYVLVRRIRDIPFQRMYLAFGVFIVTCGLTHFMDVVVIWHPAYWLDGGVRAITAVASVGTAVLLFPLIPKAVALAQTAKVAHSRGLQLETVNIELATLYQKTRETLAEAIPQLVWTTTPDGLLDYSNQRLQEFTGSTELEGDQWRRSLHPEESQRVEAAWRHSVDTGEMFESENRLRAADSSYRWFLVRGLPLRDDHGKILRWFGTCTDITERKHAEREREELLARLRESEEQLRTLANSIPQLAWMARPDGYLFWFNLRWYDYTGTKLEEMEGSGWTKVHHPDHVDRVVERIRRAWQEGEAWEDTFPLRSKDGEWRWFLSRALPLRDEAGNVVRWFGTSTDVTEQRKAAAEREQLVESLREAVRAREVFLAIAAHELKTPLTPLRFEVDIVLQRCRERRVELLTPDRLARKVERVDRQVQRLQLLVDSLLDVSRIRSGRLMLSRETVELASLTRDVCERFVEDLRATGAALEIAAETAVLVAGDRMRIEQVVTNLVSNAIRYGEGKPIHVTVTSAAGFGVLTVRDEGIGVAPADQERIFELFERASPEARHWGGLGLGLWLVRQLVVAMEGSIQLESRPGAGSTFAVRLPLKPSASRPTLVE
jgi:PAS domain S-box-containing protein